MCREEIYQVECKSKHELELSTSELEEVLEWGNCPGCGADIESVVPEEIEVKCAVCTWQETNDWEAVMQSLWSGCPRCKSRLHIAGSFYEQVAIYDEYARKNKASKYLKGKRPDYWEIVIHFCKKAELASILASQHINANPTGCFKVPAVCLTEVPLVYSGPIRKIHGNCGIAFRKSEVLKYGGQPAVYLVDVLIKAQNMHGGFCCSIKPFINILRIPSIAPSSTVVTKIDFLHEREWRVPKDIDLNVLHPLGLIFPEGKSTEKFSGPNADTLIHYAYKYGELI